ncbi:MAG: lipocalin-like domain-containing protein [Gemmatimonadota bacterium]
MQRRRLLGAAGGLLLAGPLRAAVEYATVTPRTLVFPRDHGAHPDYRTEWWYLTGWLDGAAAPAGFQVTFFRTRTSVDPANPSRFAAHQLVIAHAAIAMPTRGHLLHDQRIARTGFGIAHAAEADADVAVDRWSLTRDAQSGAYSAHVPANVFDLRLTARPTQPLLLQGDAGYSRKGPQPAQASYYYSQPQLAVDAELGLDGEVSRRRGRAWLDHEWSSTLLDPDAAGWDWIGMNLDDGGALTAFQIRRKGAGGTLYAYASVRENGAASVRTFAPDAVRFEAVSRWESPRTRAVYPVAQRITVGERVFETRPLFPDQELDSRATTGAVYWEGASTLLEQGRAVGRGYLEMTGYLAPIVL